ncbi:MAG: hypothetical protein QNI84_02655 [Henriciella sp.]|nr:hypothetical protein [Henriciella sp.]
MSFWEKGYLATGLAVLVAGSGYFAIVWKQSLALGSLAPPNWILFSAYLVVLMALSGVSFLLLGRAEARSDDGPEVGDFDERDRLIRMKSLSATSHVLSLGVYVPLVWFLFHQSGDLLFHSLIGGLVLAEATMCFLHVFNYNRAY